MTSLKTNKEDILPLLIAAARAMERYAETGKEKHYKFFLKMGDDGHLRIFETFLANVVASGLRRQILPIRATTTVGLGLLARLKRQRRIAREPVVVYLDAAHEKAETMVELATAWSVLVRPGGFLLGDDYGRIWPGVKAAVTELTGWSPVWGISRM